MKRHFNQPVTLRNLAVTLLGAATLLGSSFGLGACNSTPDGSSGVLQGIDAMVFVKRAFINEENEQVLGGMGNVFDYRRYVPGGGVFVLSPPTPDGQLTNLTEDFEAVDIAGIDMSFDATQVVFAMRHAGEDRYHVYMANVDGSGSVQQMTFGDQDDIKPFFVQEDRIGFLTNEDYGQVSGKNDEYNHSGGASQVGILYTNEGVRQLCPQNLSHVTDAFTGSDGRIYTSRWEHVENVNDLKLRVMNPDCTNDLAVAGQFNKPFNSFVQASELEPGVFIGIGTSREGTFQAGALVRADARSRTSADPNRLDVQQAQFEILTPAVPTDMSASSRSVGRYRQPIALPGSDSLLVSWAAGEVSEILEQAETAPNFGLYKWDPANGERTLIYDDPDFWDLYGIPVTTRDVPPLRGDTRGHGLDHDTPGVFGSVDIRETSLEESVSGAQFDGTPLGEALGQTRRVRIIEGFSAEIGPVREFGLTMHEGAAIIGEADVYDDYSWEASVPPYIPFRFQAIDEYGMSIRSLRLWTSLMPGEERRCGGCHESRSEDILPANGPTSLAQQAGAQDFMIPPEDRTEITWHQASDSSATVQEVFNAKCVSCHNGGTMDPFAGRTWQVAVTDMEGVEMMFDIPYLLLTETPLEVYYEEEAVAYPASYVTTVYPGAMMGDVIATGDVPPEWMVNNASRRSALVAKVNINSEANPDQWAFPTAAHPEDVGVDLTREERMMLIRAADLGNQYFTRRNVEGANNWGARDYN